MIQISEVQKVYLDLFLELSQEKLPLLNLVTAIDERKKVTKENVYSHISKLARKGVLTKTNYGYEPTNSEYEVKSVKFLNRVKKTPTKAQKETFYTVGTLKQQKIKIIPATKLRPVEIVNGKITKCPLPIWS